MFRSVSVSTLLSFCCLDEANVVVNCLVILFPEVHHHTVGADRTAVRSSVPDVVLTAFFMPSAIRVMAVGALVVKAGSQVIAARHSASLLTILDNVNEFLGAFFIRLFLCLGFLSWFLLLFLMIKDMLIFSGLFGMQLRGSVHLKLLYLFIHNFFSLFTN